MSDANSQIHDEGTAGNEHVTDPVCGMTIDSTTAAGTADFEGRRYSFCSRACKDKFDADPRRYVRPGAGASC